MTSTRLIVALWLVLLCASASAQIAAQDATDAVTIHVIQRGETLYRIALEYGVTVDDLARLNGIVDPGNIKVGDRLLVPRDEVPPVTPPATHTVQPGETLRSIAQFYGLTTDDLTTFNHLTNPNRIYVGQVLQLSPDAPEPTESPSTEVPATSTPATIKNPPPEQNDTQSTIHIVSKGETLFRIARQYGLTVNELVKANNIADPTRIYPGQELIIPGLESPELALDLPTPFTHIEVAPLVLVEGKTARFRVWTAVPVTLSGTFLGRNLNVASEEGQTKHTILQGIPMFTDAGIYPLHFSAVDASSGSTTEFEFNLEIVAGPYGRETIQLLSGRDGLLDPSVEDPEQNLVSSIMTPFTEPRYFDGPMGLPAAATVISPFGTRRSYDGGPFDHFHSGTDFAGATGTPILATAPGRVVLVDTLNVRGNATIIDHGWGVYTGYWHQTEQYVHVGDMVTTGQVIGTIGSTGRVTGPHLHWELWVGGVPVDPMQWVRLGFN